MIEEKTMKIRTIALPTSALAIALILVGCAGAPSGMSSDMPGMDHGGSSSAPEINDADVTFVNGMIPHHQQAIEMADIILAKQGVDERVTQLARTIKAAQDPEIETMTEWLEGWGQPADASMDGMEGMDHGDGMMSDDDMDALKAADGPEASRLFLEQMIEHHQGAIDMAVAEVDSGKNADALALAQTIADAQTAEILTMQGLLETL